MDWVLIITQLLNGLQLGLLLFLLASGLTLVFGIMDFCEPGSWRSLYDWRLLLCDPDRIHRLFFYGA